MTHNPAEALREAANGDRELWRGPDLGSGDYYADSVFVTKDGAIGINCGGTVVVLRPREWQRRAGGEVLLDGARPLPIDRETLGRMVREAWVRWAKTQPAPKPSWLAPYEELAEPDKEADRQIGEAIARWTLIHLAAQAAFSPPPSPDVAGVVERLRDWQDYRPMSEFCPAAIPDLLEAATLLESLSAKLQRTIEDGGFREMRQQDIIESLSAEKGQMEAALRECQKALAMMIDPNNIQLTSPLNAYAAAVSAEVRARTALTPKEKA